MAKRYPVYKGLQKPLVFKGFQGKYIYWGVGILLGGLALGAITMSLVNMWFGAIVLAGSISGGLVFLAAKQKRGLHTRTRTRKIQIHPANLKKIYRYVRKNSI